MKRVVITTGIYPPEVGGPATYVSRFAAHLASENILVTVITLTDEESSVYRENGFEITKLTRKKPKWIRSLLCAFKIFVKLRRADALLSNGLYFEAAIALKLHRKKIFSVAKVVGDPVWERERNQNKTKVTSIEEFIGHKLGFKSRVLRKLHTFSLQQFNFITVPGRGLVKVVQHWSSKLNPILIENGVPKRECKGGDKTYDLVAVSRFVPWKNLDLLIRVAKSLNLRLALVGEGPSTNHLRDVSSNYSKIFFHGRLEEEQVFSVMCKSKIYCQISDYEGLSFSLLQAMSIGLPSVLSNIVGNQQIYELDPEACILVNHKDVNELTSRISELIESESSQSYMGKKAQKLVSSHFDELTQFRKVERLLSL